jgi:hypothetical protein
VGLRRRVEAVGDHQLARAPAFSRYVRLVR